MRREILFLQLMNSLIYNLYMKLLARTEFSHVPDLVNLHKNEVITNKKVFYSALKFFDCFGGVMVTVDSSDIEAF